MKRHNIHCLLLLSLTVISLHGHNMPSASIGNTTSPHAHAGREPELRPATTHQDVSSQGLIHQTDNFRFFSNQQLPPQVIMDIAELCEATSHAIHELPLGIEHSIQKKRFNVSLFNNEASYLHSGGIKGSGGIYLPEKQQTLIRLDLLSSNSSTDAFILCSRKSKTLVHEITHQVQHEWLGKMPAWLVEGIAVYMESIPYEAGKFHFDAIDFRASEGVNHCTTNRLPVTNLEKLMSMTGSDWIEHFDHNPNGVHRHYLSAYLLTYYFLHFEGNGDAASLCEYFQAMEVAANAHAFARANDNLMNGRSIEELEADLIAAYKSKGITLVPLHGYLLSSQQTL